MYTKLQEACLGAGGDYADLRYEQRRVLTLDWTPGTGVSAAWHYPCGGLYRLLKGGAMGTCSFSAMGDLPRIQRLARTGAAITGPRVRLTAFAQVPPVHDLAAAPDEGADMQPATEEQSRNLARLGTLLCRSPGVTGAALKYQEITVLKHFHNSRGTAIACRQQFYNLSGWLSAEGAGQKLVWPLSLGGNGTLGGEEDWLPWAEEKARLVPGLLRAQSPPSGLFPVVLHPTVADLLIHEGLGHFCEADLLIDDPAALEHVRPGRVRIGSELLTVVDDATLADGPGSYTYDDEGVPGQRTVLVSQGIFTGRLHSLETAAELGESATGNGRAAGPCDSPLPRMSNILLLPGTSSLEAMLASIQNGFLVADGLTAQTVATRFSIEAAYGHVIRNGQILPDLVRGIYLKGSLKTLKHVSQVGNQVHVNRKAICGKNGQFILNSGRGCPYLKVDELWMGGTA